MISRHVVWALVSAFALAGGQAGAADGAALQALEKRLRDGEIANLHSVLVVQGDETLAEWYFEGGDERRGQSLGHIKFGPETVHDVRSVTKSIVAILFGIAQARGAIKGLDTPAGANR